MKKTGFLITLILFHLGIMAQTEDAFSDIVTMEDGYVSNWFGEFKPIGNIESGSFAMEHTEHGVLSVYYSGEDVWLYDFNLAKDPDLSGWLYTNREFFPAFYVAGDPGLNIVFLPGVEGPSGQSRTFIAADTLTPIQLSGRSSLDIAETAIGNANLESLVAALTQADLVATIQGSDALTVFAPTDAAFGKLDSSLLNSLLTDEELKSDLADILTYHVVAGEFTAKDLGFDVDNIFSGESSTKYLTTLGGIDIKIEATPFGIVINDSSMVGFSDIETSNGIVHTIDTVLLPPSDIVDTAINAGLSTLATAVTEAGLVSTLKGPGPFTVFAPTNDAFAALPDGALDNLLQDIPALSDVLLYHVVSGTSFYSADVELGPITMANGETAEITTDADGNLFIDGAEIIATDIVTANGIVHLIDSVILPPSE